MSEEWVPPEGVDPRIFFLVVVLVVLICLALLQELYKTMLVLSVVTSTLVSSLALIGIFNHGDLHKGKKVRVSNADKIIRSYVPEAGGPTAGPVGKFYAGGRRAGGYNTRHLASFGF